MGQKEEQDGCQVHPKCLTCTYNNCLLEIRINGDKRYVRYKMARMLRYDLGLDIKFIAAVIGCSPNHVWKVLREDWDIG